MPCAALLDHEHHTAGDVTLYTEKHTSHDLFLTAHDFTDLGKIKQLDLRNPHIHFAL